MSKLKIYKASAGSGKTYTLAKEYINLLFKSEDNYSHTLAVTFTNKATAEMKNRIIQELYALANGQKSPYLEDIAKDNDLSNLQIRNKSKVILNEILHNFSRFSITTIDSFIQRVLQAFTREIGMQHGYEVDFDVRQVLQDAIDKVFDDITHNEFLKEWLLKFTDHKIKESKSWNLVNDLLALGQEIFKEDYKQLNKNISKKLSDKEYLDQYVDYLVSKKKDMEREFSNVSSKALTLIKDNGLSIDDFAYKKSGFLNVFNKVSNKDYSPAGARTLGAIDDIEKWWSKKASPSLKVSIENIYSELNGLLSEVCRMLTDDVKEYNTINLIQKHFFALGIVTDIDKKISDFQVENNRILISEGASLLNDIIDNNHAPFIYEKYGQTFRNFMIDEFQDTSSVQWNNFRPLLENCLSEGNTALVVGDIKQSIYRWRNGDWKLLANKLKEDMSIFGVDDLTLSHNWRSKENVIRFNNTAFQVALEILSDLLQERTSKSDDSEYYINELKSAYDTIIQLVPPVENVGGNVEVKFIEEDTDKEEFVKNTLPEAIEKLQDRGYQARDIAVLVRKGSEGTFIADLMMEYKDSEDASDKYNYDVISNDSLVIGASYAVKFIICVLRYVIDPKDRINCAQFLHVHYQCITETPKSLFDVNYFENIDSGVVNLLGRDLVERLNQIKTEPILNQIEHIISMFDDSFFSGDMAYVQAFKDAVFDYCEKRTEDLTGFLEWWEGSGASKKISASENQNAINIMTIHKSKGLEFKAVIVPFCDWSLEHDRVDNIIWAKTDIEPYSYIDALPVNFSKSSLENSFFEDDYYMETLQTYVDNINMLYVAFTRAENDLIVYAKPTDMKLKELKKCKKVSDLLLRSFTDYNKYVGSINDNCVLDLSQSWNADSLTFKLGDFENVVSETRNTNNEILIDEFQPRSNKKFKLRLKNHVDEIVENTGLSMVDYGIRMHKLFETVQSSDDFENVLDNFIYSGLIQADTKDSILNRFKESLKTPEISDWFDSKYEIRAENSIIIPGGAVYRPDRILICNNVAKIIDYKFGDRIETQYKDQLLRYKQYMNDMGFEASAFIWYWSLNHVVEIE